MEIWDFGCGYHEDAAFPLAEFVLAISKCLDCSWDALQAMESLMRLDQSSMDIQHLVDKVRSGQLDLQPDFQRGQVWAEPKKKRLVDTILREWYIPAIHIVVNDELDREEVLDGQQRLRAILDFIDGNFSIDGHLPPRSHDIESLHGLFYDDLPDRVKSRFKRFTLTTVRLRDYRPDEPGELFFRLNQLTALTAAEQRNALIGEPRNQIKRLAERLEESFAEVGIGFSNVRMNYDDVLSRLAVSLEARSLAVKMTSQSLERRYRSGAPFSSDIFSDIADSMEILSAGYYKLYPWRQNKASLFSWLYFIVDTQKNEHVFSKDDFRIIFNVFEAGRHSLLEIVKLSDLPFVENIALLRDRSVNAALSMFNDRASSRVNDTSSLLLRDLALNIVAWRVRTSARLRFAYSAGYTHFLEFASNRLLDANQRAVERLSIESDLASKWSKFRETRQTS